MIAYIAVLVVLPWIWGSVESSVIIETPPMPYYLGPQMCDEDGQLGGYNDTCSSPRDCGHGLQCIDSRCQCREGTFLTSRNLPGLGLQQQPFCQPAPHHGQACSTQCAPPFECVGGGNWKTCQCPQGLNFQFGFCYKECPAGYFFAMNAGECRPTSALNAQCQFQEQCVTPYSECSNNRCQCMNGLRATGNVCSPMALSCPYGAVPTNPQGQPITCERTPKDPAEDGTPPHLLPKPVVPPMSAGGLNQMAGYGSSGSAAYGHMSVSPMYFGEEMRDNCPDGLACLTHNPWGPGTGHCCQKENSGCPVGLPHPTASCTPPLGEPYNEDNLCPHQSHHCYSKPGSFDNSDTLCCPKPCKASDVYKDGQCYPYKDLGELCQLDIQCQTHGGQCVNGRCICPESAKLVENGPHKHCQVMCQPTEYVYKFKCYPRQEIGDNCTNSEFCPEGGICKRGKCACQCGMKPLSSRMCGPKPTCRNGPMMAPPPFFAAGETMSFESSEFCKVDKNPLSRLNVTVVDSCSMGKYCAPYTRQLGLCCDKPDPVCPDGSPPMSNAGCSPRHQNSCGSDQFCYNYLNFARPSLEGGAGWICCTHKIRSNSWNQHPVPRIQN